MFNLCWVRMVGAFKVHLVPNLKSSSLLRQLRNNVPEAVKNILFCVNYLISYVLFRVSRTEELMIQAAVEACDVEEPIIEQQVLIPHDEIIVNGVQDPGFTPFEEFLPRSAPTIALSVSQLCQVPDITRQSLSSLKAQIREDQGRARDLRTKAAEKEADFKRSQREELRLSSQADRLGDKLAKMDRQEARLNRKIYILNNEHGNLLTNQSEANHVIWMATWAIKKGDQNQLVVLVDQVEAKTREANLRSSKA